MVSLFWHQKRVVWLVPNSQLTSRSDKNPRPQSGANWMNCIVNEPTNHSGWFSFHNNAALIIKAHYQGGPIRQWFGKPMKCMAVTQMRETLGYFYKCPNLNVLDIASGNWLGNKLPMMIVKQWAEQGISVQTGSDWVQYQVTDFNKRLTA